MESIFLSHHFDDQIEPVVECFHRLIKSHDLEVIDGKRLQGELVETKVRELIVSSDAVVVFLSKREDGKTNDWVKHERSIAQTLGKPIIAIIEKGVLNPPQFSGYETMEYDSKNLVKTVLELSENIFGWKEGFGKRIKASLEPDEIVKTVMENYGREKLVQYRFYRKGSWSSWKEATILRMPAGPILEMNGMTEDALVEIQVKTQNQVWTSETVNSNLRIKVI
ncbi:hypothetical protein FEE95_00980 [Maribacter algarum]|uniref:TIR domain-containing protein n=1 Tax=Maribacter algarum (ex Zhang et al. 2020) TaxID=2578118 RepID=A0A5S3PSX3_9FLAO|nr:TIR domain-containing protein [Maribacter algarum]TMM58030.1 hypothetical protein FEE95_00980 [Maribacter algarum]